MRRVYCIFVLFILVAVMAVAGESYVGTERGLYAFDEEQGVRLLWGESEVRKVVKSTAGYYLLSGKGVIFSADLKTFSERNSGIGRQVYKLYDGERVSYESVPGPLFDLELDPFNNNNMALSSRFGIYVTYDGGLNWHYNSNPSYLAGNKAISIFTVDKRVYLIHSGTLRGVFYSELKSGKVQGWMSLNKGLYKTQVIFEELSDITVSRATGKLEVFAANSFFPRLYTLDWQSKEWKTIHKEEGENETIDSLAHSNEGVLFLSRGKIASYNPRDGLKKEQSTLQAYLGRFRRESGQRPLALYSHGAEELVLSELWLVEPPEPTLYMKRADKKNGLYLPITYARSKERLEQTVGMMKGLGLNMVVIDMKDDFGVLRFKTDNEMLNRMGLVRNPYDVKGLLDYFKKEGIYTVARMVIFKDPILYKYAGGRLAVKDKSSKRPWQGYYNITDGSGDVTVKLIEEYWVDPYSEEVWAYNVEVAKELVDYGFDEIQFDYIRFPTDGVNLANATYDYQGKGMSKQDALLSFLRYARANIKAPISIDVYGANGWHRMGGTTGQDVELMAKYVDVVCPMFYPSHFSQDFLNYQPYDQRTYRIYYYGSFRNHMIGRGEFLVRPYTQSFKLGVSYDRAYYGHDYVFNQIKGLADSVNQGYTFWDASGRYYYLYKALEPAK